MLTITRRPGAPCDHGWRDPTAPRPPDEAAAAATGLTLCALLTVQWGRSGFGALDPEVAMRQIIPGVALLLVGTQSVLASIFFAALRSAFDSSRLAPPLPNSVDGFLDPQ